MVRLALLLLGIDFVRARWRALAAIGVIWLLLGIALFIDALDGVLYFPLNAFAWLLLVEGVVALLVAFSGLVRQNALRIAKGLLFIVIAALIIAPLRHNGDFALAMLFGLLFTIGGALRVSAAWVVRFGGWRGAMGAGVLELLFATFMFEPWPTHYAGTVPYCIGFGLALTGWSLIRLALRLRNAPDDARGLLSSRRGHAPIHTPIASDDEVAPTADLIVHVWTPVGSASDALRRPIVDRYIAAIDGKGVISTGHAALEMPPDLYVSHYPAVEIERSPDQFNQTLLATAENNVPGRFQPSYAFESRDWCESTEKVVFSDYSPLRLHVFWAHYSRDTTYNLTNRNCSSTAIAALEASLEGVIGRRGGGWRSFARVLLSPETWVASQLYRRAETMAWTPGLALDYARALRGIVQPQAVAWLTLARMAMRTGRQSHPPTNASAVSPDEDD
ncbi:MAG: hypothetical protein ABI843_01495 [Dokdonella sp.]